MVSLCNGIDLKATIRVSKFIFSSCLVMASFCRRVQCLRHASLNIDPRLGLPTHLGASQCATIVGICCAGIDTFRDHRRVTEQFVEDRDTVVFNHGNVEGRAKCNTFADLTALIVVRTEQRNLSLKSGTKVNATASSANEVIVALVELANEIQVRPVVADLRAFGFASGRIGGRLGVTFALALVSFRAAFWLLRSSMAIALADSLWASCISYGGLCNGCKEEKGGRKLHLDTNVVVGFFP